MNGGQGAPEGRPCRVLLADDEPLARRTLRELLASDPEVTVVAECADGAEAISDARALSPDILFLDIKMPGLGGFDVVEALGEEHSGVLVFVTAYEEHAIRAFEERALDYVLKPFSEERFRQALERAKARVAAGRWSDLGRRLVEATGGGAGMLAESPAEEADPEGLPLERLAVGKGDRTLLVDVGRIDWIEGADYYSRLHLGGESHLLRRSLRWLEGRLARAGFLRVHRSAIVRLDRVAEIQRLGADDYRLLLRDGSSVPLSRSGRAQILRWLDAQGAAGG